MAQISSQTSCRLSTMGGALETCTAEFSLWKLALDEFWPSQSQLRVAVLKLTKVLKDFQGSSFSDRTIAERMLRDCFLDLEALNARSPKEKRIKRVGRYRSALTKMGSGNKRLGSQERTLVKNMLEDYTRCLEEHQNLEAGLEEVHALINMIEDDGVLTQDRFDIMTELLTESLRKIEALVTECSRLQSFQVFHLQCEFLIKTVSLTVHDRLRHYHAILLNLKLKDGVQERIGFCIEAVSELSRQLQSVLELLTMCCKQDWWVTALELAMTTPALFRWSRFTFAVRACEWSMDVLELAFQALLHETLCNVDFRWAAEKIRMVLFIDGKQLYHEEGQGQRARLQVQCRGMETRELESKDNAALVKNLVTATHPIAHFSLRKFDGPKPERNCLPWTFRIDPPTIKFINRGVAKWLGQDVAVKRIETTRRRFEQEVANFAMIQHPNIVRMIGCAYEEKTETGLLVMELMEHDLQTVIDMRSPFPVMVAIDIMLQIGEAMVLLSVHEILHGGLKAKNILVKRAGPSLEHYIVKLADFGIGKVSTGWPAPPAAQEVHNDRSGWPPPPPMVPNERRKYEWRADVYSFGMTCYEIITGRVPSDDLNIVGGDRSSLENCSIPSDLKNLIHHCWASDLYERPNFQEICKSLWRCKVDHIET